MSNVLKYIHRALTPIVIVMAIQVSAASIKIVGPDGEQKAEQAPSSSSQVVRPTRVSPSPVIGRSQAAALPITYGPTSSADTLWSIATKLRPSTATTIQQTVLAIYRLNPQAFEDNNIHSLHSNSVLRIPSLTQVRNESQASAVRILREHQALLNQVNAPVVVATPVPIIPKTSEATASARPSVVKPVAEIAKTKPVVIKSTISDAELMALKKELESNEVEYSALEESNHTLRLKLANVQYEVEALKDAISDEDRIRDEVQKFIDEQKLTLKKEVAVEISLIDKIAESPAMIIALALIPGSMIAGLIAFLLFRRKKEAVEAEPEEPSVVNVEPEINMDDDIPELTLSDDDDELLSNFDDETEALEFDPNEAFGDDSVDPFVSTEEEAFEDKSLDGEDPFAVIDDALQEELINEETEVTSNNFSVDAGVKALGLEEMERALDEIDSGLNTEDDTDEDFDLSLSSLEDLDGADDTKDGIDLSGDDSDLSKDSIALDDDERKGSTESSDDNLDFEWDAQESEEDTFSLESTDEVEVNSNDLDFDTLLDTDASVNRETDSTDFDLDGDTHDELFASSSIESSELNAEDTFELSSDSTKLLDEVMEQSNEESENSDLFEIDPQNTELLDELLAEHSNVGSESDSETEKVAADSEFEIDEQSTELLDELLSESVESDSETEKVAADSEFEIDEQSTELLDELLSESVESDSETEKVAADSEFEIDEQSTELLDELLSESVESDSETEKVAADSEFEIDEQSTELLDELLSESVESDSETGKVAADSEFEIDEQSTELLDELLSESIESDSETEKVAADSEFEIDEQSTELLDELLSESIESDSSAPEPIAAQEDTVESAPGIDEQSSALLDELLSESVESDSSAPEPIAAQEDTVESAPGIDEQSSALLDELLSESVESDTSAPEPIAAQEDTVESAPGIDEQSSALLDELLSESVESESESEPVATQEVIEESIALSDDEPRDEDWLVDADEDIIENEDASLEVLSIDDALTELAKEDTDSIEETNIQEESTKKESTKEDREQLFTDLDFPVYGEDEALADAQTEASEAINIKSEPTDIDAQPYVLADEELGEFGEAEAISNVGLTDTDVGDDWSGFKFQSDTITDENVDIPADESGAWGTDQTPEPDLELEDWSNQPEFESAIHDEDKFISIDTLIAQSESGESKEVDEQRDLNVGLNEFPDVIGEVGDVDVDLDKESQSKLDLAKAYLEMSDSDGARELLEDVLSSSDEKLKTEAALLLKTIAK